jgi:hypothetical protein
MAKINLKAGEHIRIENDSGAGFTTYLEGNIIHITARSQHDPMPVSEIVRPDGFWYWSPVEH